MEAARVHAELTVHDLWLRYLALGGTGDAFDVDGYLQSLVPLNAFQQDVLAQAANEGLADRCHAFRVPLSTSVLDPGGDERLRQIVDELLSARSPTPDPKQYGGTSG